jgi:DNA-binding NtrC family response regulator
MRALNVLVVGDDHDTVMNLGILLRSEGINVSLATGAEQVPRATAQFQPDAVLLDVPKPASALAVGKALAQCCGPHRPFLYHVAKPLDPDAVLQIVRSITPS